MNAGSLSIRWRCRRGTRELDLLLQGYLEKRFEQAGEPEKEAFLSLLELPDERLTRYLFGIETPEEPGIGQIVAQIRSRPAV